jgi:hypothetical protein
VAKLTLHKEKPTCIGRADAENCNARASAAVARRDGSEYFRAARAA